MRSVDQRADVYDLVQRYLNTGGRFQQFGHQARISIQQLKFLFINGTGVYR